MASGKELKEVDISLPDHVVKGAVLADVQMARWNPSVHFVKTANSGYVTINKQAEDLSGVIATVVQDLMLPSTEEYSLMLEKPRAFLGVHNTDRLHNGFIIFVTATPAHYARRIHEDLKMLRDRTRFDEALKDARKYASDMMFVKEFYKISSIQQFYNLLNTEVVEGSGTCRSNCLGAIEGMLDLCVDGVGWTTVPSPLVVTLATFVTGRAKSEDPDTVLQTLHMIELLVECNNEEIKASVFSEVPLQSLIRHLEGSQKRIKLAALSLMNALYRNATHAEQKDMITHLNSTAFWRTVSGSVLRNVPVGERILADHDPVSHRQLEEQMIPLQRILLDDISQMTRIIPTDEECQSIMELSIFVPPIFDYDMISSDYSIPNNDDSFLSELSLLKESPLGQLGTNILARLAEDHAEEIKAVLGENAMRPWASAWQPLPVCLQCLEILCRLLHILPPSNSTGNDSSDVVAEDLIEVFFSVDRPLVQLLALTIQLFHRTWREMKAVNSEAHKVGAVVREQLVRVSSTKPGTLDELDNGLRALPYWEMQELWSREETERETGQLNSQVASSLRVLLRPSLEDLVKKNRRILLKQGSTFLKTSKQRNLKEFPYVFWRLDASEKMIHMVETDSNPYLEHSSKTGTEMSVFIRSIMRVKFGDDLAMSAPRKSTSILRGLCLEVVEDEAPVVVAAPSDRVLCYWIDALNDLIGNSARSRDWESTVDRLLDMELRLRLMAIAESGSGVEKNSEEGSRVEGSLGEESLAIPPLPSNMNWVVPFA